MTLFYVLLWEFWRKRTDNKRGVLSAIVYAIAACRIALCLFPQNDWFSADAPLSWGIYRNVPFVILGGIVAWRLFKDRGADKHFRLAWLAVTLSFLFYLPVVLFVDAVPVIGMLMLPKTVCYVWLVVMGYPATKRNE
jgi:peptidoglycan/LPS O-acetylase OafA/YrhL